MTTNIDLATRPAARRAPGLIFAAVLLIAALPVTAQETVAALELPDAPSFLQQAAAAPATVMGVASDVNGGIVPNAQITLNKQGHPEPILVIASESDGSFHFANLPVGTYTVTIAAQGLETFRSEAFTLKPGEHYELPAVALPIASATTTVNVVMTTAQIADEELKLETQQRVFAIFPNFYTSFLWNAAPMNTKQKFRLSFRTVTDPVAFIGTAVTAGIETANNTFPDWGQDAPSYGKRFGAAYGDQLFGRMLGSAVFPSIFHQDPRYFFMGPNQPTKARLKHALLNGVEARGDNGKWQPNYSHILGNAAAGALSSVYHPASEGAGKLALLNGLIGVAGGAVQGLVREFVTSRVTHKVPKYANGKPATKPAIPNQPAPAATPALEKPTPAPAT